MRTVLLRLTHYRNGESALGNDVLAGPIFVPAPRAVSQKIDGMTKDLFQPGPNPTKQMQRLEVPEPPGIPLDQARAYADRRILALEQTIRSEIKSDNLIILTLRAALDY
ncbi:MAG TPA: hypothetical protein VEB43_16770 [Anaeromyxobacter sp.]|nr:hypothetical protein [Anaeromyxobacter sp.]